MPRRCPPGVLCIENITMLYIAITIGLVGFYFYYNKGYRPSNFIFKRDDILLFGRESKGVPLSIHSEIKDKLKIPINKKTRSLNVAMSVAIVSSEA